MKSILVILAVVTVTWHYYQKQHKSPVIQMSDLSSSYSNQSFTCDGRTYCSQMTSREEAEFFIQNCPDTKMDGDHDGVPCENDTRF